MEKSFAKKMLSFIFLVSAFLILFVIFSTSQSQILTKTIDSNPNLFSNDNGGWKLIQSPESADAWTGGTVDNSVYGTADTNYWELNCGGEKRGPSFGEQSWNGTQTITFPALLGSIAKNAPTGSVQIYLVFTVKNGYNKSKVFYWRAMYSDGTEIGRAQGAGENKDGNWSYNSGWINLNNAKSFASITTQYQFWSGNANVGEIANCIIRVRVNDNVNPSTSTTGTANYSSRTVATSSAASFSITDTGSGIKTVDRQMATFANKTNWTQVGNDQSFSTYTPSTTIAVGSTFGDYKVVVTDQDLHTATSSTIRYWIPTLKTTSTGASGGTTTSSITGGTQYIGTESTSTTISLARNPGQTFYLRAKPDLGYLFNGFTIEYAKLNSDIESTEISYSKFSYSGGFFYYAITLSDNLCELGNTYSTIAFKANFQENVVAKGTVYSKVYSGADQDFSTSSPYLQVATGAIGSDRELAITAYKYESGSYGTSKPKYAGKYSVRLVIRKKSDTSVIYATYELSDVMEIERKEVTITFTSSNKTYDASNSASINSRTLGGGIAADGLSISGGSATFDNKNVGNNKYVTVTGFKIIGSNLGSYKYRNNSDVWVLLDGNQNNMGTKTLVHNITYYEGATLLLKLKEAHKNKSRIYDNTDFVDATWFEVVINGLLGNDQISLDSPYPTANTYGKTVDSWFFKTDNIYLTGDDCQNYRIANLVWNSSRKYPANSENAANGYNKIAIAKKPIGITVTVPLYKTYDGTVTIGDGTTTLDPVVAGSGDYLVLKTGITYTFADKHVGNGKIVTANNLSLNESASSGYGNYAISFSNNTTTAHIYKKNITISMQCAEKIYDGTTNVEEGSLSFRYTGIVASDAEDALNGIANPTWLKMGNSVVFKYVDKNVSANATVISTNEIVLAGASMNNYTVTNESLSCTASVKPKSIVGGQIIVTSLGNIIYDGDTHQPIPPINDNGIIVNGNPYLLIEGSNNDYTISYPTIPSNVGTYTVNIQGVGNYTGQRSTTLKIDKANVALEVDDINIIYGAVVTHNSIQGVAKNASKTSVVLAGGTFRFDDSTPMPATPPASEVDGYGQLMGVVYSIKYTLSSTDSGNYNPPNNVSLTLNVSKKDIIVNVTEKNQVFGEPAVALTWTSVDPYNHLSNGIVGTDNLGVVLQCDKNIPEGRIFPNVGEYTIGREIATSLNSNYNVTFNESTYTISKRSIRIIPTSGQSKTYGHSDPVFQYSVSDVLSGNTPLSSVLLDSPLVGSLARELTPVIPGPVNRPGEDVGDYRIIQNTLNEENNTNYDIQFSAVAVAFEITKRFIQISAPQLSTIYGEALLDTNYIVTAGSLYSDDTLTGSFSRTLSAQSTQETLDISVGTYVLKDNLNTSESFRNVANNPNYDVNQVVNGTYTINRRPIVVTPTQGLQKSYGSQDPQITYSLSYFGDPEKDALVNSDSLTGSLSRVSGNNVATYAITIGSLSNTNYNITLSAEIFTINKLAVAVLANLWDMDYGAEVKKDSDLTWVTTPAALPFNDVLYGELKLDDIQWEIDEFGAVPVGEYDISQGTLTNENNPNYSITFNGTKKYIVNALVANIKPLAGQFAEYGATLTGIYDNKITFFAYTNGGVQISASYFSGKLNISSVLETPTPGNYEIVKGSLDSATHIIQMNYEMNAYGVIVPSQATYFTINKREIAIQPTEVSQVFGEDEIAATDLSWTIATGSLVGNDELTGELERESTGIRLTVGSYSINKGTVTHPYYNIAIVNNNGKYKVARRPIVILPLPTSSIYGQATDSKIDYEITLREGFSSEYDPIIPGYELTGSLSRASSNVLIVGDYPIIQGSLANPNYDIQISSTIVYYTIMKRPVSIKADDKTQIFGSLQSTLTYSFIEGTRAATWDNGLLSSSTTLAKTEGITVGTYEITAGNMLSPGINPNYEITFTPGVYTIEPKPVTVTPLSNQSKEYGKPDPVFSYAVSSAQGGGLVEGYELLGILSRDAGENVGSYKISQGTLNNLDGKNPNYAIAFNEFISFGITQATSFITFNDSTTSTEDGYILSLVYSGLDVNIDAALNHSETSISYSIENSFKDVGLYSITLSVAQTRNYKATAITVSVDITPYELENISREAIIDNIINLKKIYGDNDQEFKKTIEGLANDSPITVQFVRTAGESVGVYSLEIASHNNPNYVVSLAPNAGIDIFTITKREIKLDAIDTVTKIYDGIASGQTSVYYPTGFFNDNITITYFKEEGANVGKYDIASYVIDDISEQNYSLEILDLTDRFEVTRRPVYITADEKTIQYGDSDVELTFTILATNENSGLLEEEGLNGSLIREQGRDAGSYVISAGSLTNANNGNYEIVLNESTYTIVRMNIEITPESVLVEYGEDSIPLIFNINRSLVGDDILEGELTREENNNVGVYDILQGTLSNQGGKNKNYDITFISGAKYTITPRSIAVTPNEISQVYGDPVKNITFEITQGELAYAETQLYGRLDRGGTDVGTYSITIGTLAEENKNYDITLTGNINKYTIEKRAITIKANETMQVYGNPFIPLSYSVTKGSVVPGDLISGSLFCGAQDAKDVGTYAIFGETLNNSNYDITYESALYIITKRPLTIQLLTQETQYKESEDLLEIDQLAYTFISGTMAYNQKASVLNIVITKEPGHKMAHYELSATYANANYEVEFLDGVFIIHKNTAFITTDFTSLTFTYDGNARHINATCNSNEEVRFYLGEVEVNNGFANPGKYNLTLMADENDAYYSPEPVQVLIVILRDKLVTESNGIDATLVGSDGFDPELILNMEKVDTKSKEIQDQLTRYQDVIRSFNLSILDPDTHTVIDKGISSIRIKVPGILSDDSFATILVSQNGVYSSYSVPIDQDGYITVSGDNINSISFLQETNAGNTLVFVIVGIIALIVIIGFGMLLFRKRY